MTSFRDNRPLLVAIAFGCCVFSGVAPPRAQAQDRQRTGYFEPWSRSGRFGVGLGQSRRITVDAEGNRSEETGLDLSALLGIGLALHPRLAADLDTGLLFELSPDAGLSQVTVTPGVRALVFPQLYLRLASLNYLLDPANALALAGVGYYLSGDRIALFVELNYAFWSWRETQTRFFPRLGVEAAF